MKKNLLLIALSSLLFTSCGASPNTSNENSNNPINNKDDESEKENKDEGNTENPTGEKEDEQGSDKPSDNPSEKEDLVVTDETSIETTSWNDDIEKMITYVLGENHPAIPKFTTRKYQASIIVDSTSGTSIKVASIKCYTSLLSLAASNYEKSLTNNGFILHSEQPYGYKMLSYTTDLCVQYEAVEKSDNDEAHFLLLIYKVDMRIGEWYGDQIEYYIGASIPKFEAPSYYYDLDPYTFAFTVLANFTKEGDLDKYAENLANLGYIPVSTSVYDYEFKSPDLYIDIKMYETSTDYEQPGVYIKIENAWPHVAVMALCGNELPKLREKCEGFSYNYVDSTKAYCLFFDNSDENEFEKYKSLLTGAGYALENETYETTSGTNSTYYNYYLSKNRTDGSISSLQLMYYVEGNVTALAIYE